MKNQNKDKFIFIALIAFFSLMIIFGFAADRFDSSKPLKSQIPFLGQALSLFSPLAPSDNSVQPVSPGFNNADSTGTSIPLVEQSTPAIAPAPETNFQLKTLANKATAPAALSKKTVSQDASETPPVFLETTSVFEKNIPQDTASQLTPISPKQLKIRKLEKEIKTDKQASNRCYVKPFVTNLSGVASAQAEIIFEIAGGMSAEIEVGSLPIDIDLVFSQNNDYFITPQSGVNRLGLTINKGEQSQKGSFSIPIIFTKKGVVDSATICQINIINL